MKRFTFSLGAVLAVLLMLGAPLAVRAQNKEAAAEAQHTKKSVIVPETINVITTLIVFGLLLIILRVFAWKPILQGLQKREENIRGALEAAEHARKSAELTEQEFRRKMIENDEKIRQEFEKARQHAQQLADEFLTQARADITQDRQRLQREIETAKDQALQVVWKQAVELAALMSSKALQRQVSVEDDSRLVDESLAELRQQNGAIAVGGRS